ncbi:MAG: DUF1761 domain-containing protein [Pseudomonadota bacterium]
MALISSLNVIAIGAATLAGFFFGAIWYSALAKPWMRAARIDPSEAKMGPALFATTFVVQLVMAFGLALILRTLVPAGGLWPSIQVALVGWLALCAAPMTINHRYQNAGWDLTIIDSLHWLAVLLIMTIVITAIG